MSLLESLQANKALLVSVIVLSCLFFLGQIFQTDFVFERNAISNGQWWKVLSGNFTHSNIPHLLLNLSGLWILLLLFIDSLNSKTFILSTAILTLFVGLGLYHFTAELDFYYGFSGVLYGLYFIGAVCAILKQDYFTGISVAILIAGKIFWDYFSGGNQSSAELIGIPVANDAHLYGFCGAFIISIFLVLKQRLKS